MMKRTRIKIAALVGGSVLAMMLLVILILTIIMNARMTYRAEKSIDNAFSRIYDVNDYDYVYDDEEQVDSLYYAEIFFLSEDSYNEDIKHFTEREKKLVEWALMNMPIETTKTEIGRSTYFLRTEYISGEYEPTTILVYVDVTGEPEMLGFIIIIIFIAAIIIGTLGTIEGYYIGKRLEQNEVSQRIFFENTSHELKTPLAAIRGYAEGIETGVITDYKKTGQVIASQTEKMSSLVEEILYLSKIESGVQPLKKEQIDMPQFIENCLMPFEGAVKSRGIEVELDLKAGIISADPAKLEHALTNLLTNSIKYAKTVIRISFSGRTLKIWNDTDNITKDDISHIFDRFYTGRNGNTGIGLAIVREVVDLHGFKISASAENGGLVFTINM